MRATEAVNLKLCIAKCWGVFGHRKDIRFLILVLYLIISMERVWTSWDAAPEMYQARRVETRADSALEKAWR